MGTAYAVTTTRLRRHHGPVARRAGLGAAGAEGRIDPERHAVHFGGVIVEQRVVKTLLNQPQHARTQDFLRRVLRPL